MKRDRSGKSCQSKPKINAGPLTPVKTPESGADQTARGLAIAVDSITPPIFHTPISIADGDLETDGKALTAEIDAELASHTHHRSPNPALALPPVELSKQLSSSACKRLKAGSGAHKEGRSGTAGEEEEKADMDGSARMGPPETPGRRVVVSPQFFPSLQFSPDLFNTPHGGPATAPILPQNRLFWDPSTDPEDAAFQDPFSQAHSDIADPFTPSPVISHGFQSTGSVSSHHGYDLPKSDLVAPISPSLDGTGFAPGFTASPRVPIQAPDDPSMFLSSPARRFGPAIQPLSSSTAKPRRGLGAYHHQMEEFKREEEHERSKRARVTKSETKKKAMKRPSSPVMGTRPALKRSSTHSGLAIEKAYSHQRQQSQVSSLEFAPISSGSRPQGGRSSPLKRSSLSSYGLDRPSSRNRTSLSFTIDKDGRAKTLITKVPDRPNSRMDLDDASTESECDSVDAADFDVAPSQQTSFAFPGLEEQNHRIEKMKFDSKTHSKSSSYSSTIESGSALPSSRTSSIMGGPRSHRQPADPRFKAVADIQARRGLPAGHSHPLSTNSDETVLDDESGDAQQALRAMFRDRHRPHSGMTAFNSRTDACNITNFHSSPPLPSSRNINYGIFNASPTTVTDPDLTPSTDRGSHSSHRSDSSTRCICNSLSPDGNLMIQCECCSKWLHATCVGIATRADVPPVYICVYCAQTPMRHGRVRESSRAAAMAPVSPLAGKKGGGYRGR